MRALAAERNAVILAHNYQVPEIQDLADFVGDSLGLSRQAAATDAEMIVFCGVHFMAETASILAPEKTVLIPDLDAGCSLADSITPNELRNWKQRYPEAVVVMYVNTSAEVKAETDYCCTSANAVEVVEHVRAEHGDDVQILFGPDMWLGTYVERVTGKPMIVWPGECHVHAGIKPDDINRMRAERPGSEFLIHPECGCATQCVEYGGAGEIADGRAHARHRRNAQVRRPASRRRLHRRHRDRDAAPAAQGSPTGAADRRQPEGGVQVHEDDHAAEAARLAARRASTRLRCLPTSPHAPACRSSAWWPSADRRDLSARRRSRISYAVPGGH